MGQRRRFSAVVVAAALCTSLSAPVAAGAVEPPPGPSITVDPSVDLVSGQSVEVTGVGFPAGTSVGVIQCENGAFELSGCDMGEFRLPVTDAAGSFTTTIGVRRRIWVDGEILDCAAAPGACMIGAAALSDYETSAGAPLSFDPDAPVPTEPTATADPASGLLDRDEVHVWGGGFGPEAPLMVAQCPAGADPESCTIRTGDMTDLDGLFGANLGVRRVVTDGGATLDCASAEGACEIVVFDTDDTAQLVRVPVSFDPDGPMPVPVTVSVEPSTDLLDMQEVTVTGAHFEPGAWAEVSLCALEGGAPGWVCDYLWVEDGIVDESGAVSATVPLPRQIPNWDGDPVDCAVAACAVVVEGYGNFHDRGFAPVSFDPEVPLPDPPVVTVDPDEGLVDRQSVQVDGSGFGPGSEVSVRQCTMHPEGGRVCNYMGSRDVVADATGTISTELTVRRRMSVGSDMYAEGGAAAGAQGGAGAQGWDDLALAAEAGEPDVVDCADAPGTCFVLAYSYYDPFDRVAVPISFDPEVPVFPPPTATVDPSTGLADRQIVEVSGAGFVAGEGVAVRQCAEHPEYGQVCAWNTSPGGVADETGSMSADLRVRRTISVYDDYEGEVTAAGGVAAGVAGAPASAGGFVAGDAEPLVEAMQSGGGELLAAAPQAAEVIDCADAPGTCWAEVVSEEYSLDRATVPLSFDPEAPPFPLPTITVEPTEDLADRQAVHITGEGFASGEGAGIAECAVSSDPEYPPNPCRTLGVLTADPAGDLDGDVNVRRVLGSMSSDPVDCASSPGRCMLKVSVPWFQESDMIHVPLSFDPESPIVLPALTVTPEVGLSDGQTVDVHGTGYSSGAWIGLAQCEAEAMSTSRCDLSQIGYAYADGAGVLDTTFDVHSTIHVGGDTIDCAAVPGSCVVGAANISDYAEAAKANITFGDPPVVAAGGVEAAEGDDGPTTVEVPLHLSTSSMAPVSVHWELVGGSATGGSDFLGAPATGAPAAMSGDVTFPPQTTEVVVPVTISGDVLDEDDETFELALSSPRNAAVSPESGVVTILDDDDPPVVAAGMAGIWEGGRHDDTVVEIPVFLSAPSGKRVTVDVRTRGWTARRHRDFVPSRDTIVFEPGEVSKYVEVEIVGDRRPEPLEAFLVKLSNAQNAEIGGVLGLGLALIWDDDAPHRH